MRLVFYKISSLRLVISKYSKWYVVIKVRLKNFDNLKIFLAVAKKIYSPRAVSLTLSISLPA